MTEVRQDKTPLASSMMMFDVTMENATGTIFIHKSISYKIVALLASVRVLHYMLALIDNDMWLCYSG
jgi:hypothetical protein